MQRRVIDFFYDVLIGKTSIFDQINNFKGQVYFCEPTETTKKGEKSLCFTLLGLFELLKTTNDFSDNSSFHNLNYADFQRGIYSSDINEKLQQLGGKIEIHKSYGKVNKNIYCFSSL